MDSLDEVTDYLVKHNIMLVTAESCSAGMIGAMLGNCPGCGQWLDSGFVTYSIEAKNRLLGVSFSTIEECGLTSEEVAQEMALGALHRVSANAAISNTGVAGPDDGDDGTPAGTVCFAWAFQNNGKDHVFTETKRFFKDRNGNREEASEYALARIPHYYQMLSQSAR